MSRRRNHVLWTSIVLIVLISILFARASAEGGEEAAWVDAGQATLGPFKQRLMMALKEALSGGPEAAIDACRLEAPRIAGDLASASIRVGRTSDRLRNPANAPKAWMRPVLREFAEAPRGEQSHRIVRITDDWVGYAEPIYVQPLCLTCHGSDLAPSISDLLHALYPQDRATDFAVGDLRGLFWVELETRDGASDAVPVAR